MYIQEPLPFYKAYPLESFLAESRWMEKEKEKMMSYLPAKYYQLQKSVEGICDELEYDGSRMYDEEPDSRMFRDMVQKVILSGAEEKEQKYMEDIAGCFLCNEMLYRRYRKRRAKKYIK